MVAPQGLNETSFGPELNFTVISRAKFPKKAIVKRKVYDDEEMFSPYVRKSKKELEIRNYRPNALYTVGKLARSSQSPKSVYNKSETKKKKHHMIKLAKADKVRRKEFHVKESERIDSKKVSKDLRHMSKNQKHMSKKKRHKQNPTKLAVRSVKPVKMSRKEKNRQEFIDENNMEDALLAYHKFFETMRKRKDFLFKGYNKCFNLSHLSRQERLRMKSDCDTLYPHLKAINRFHCYLVSLQEQHIINEKLRSERFYRKREMEREEENVRKNLKCKTSESTQESTSFSPPLSPKRLKIQQKKSKLINKYRERAQEVYDNFWKLKFEVLDAKMARGIHEKDDFDSIPTRFLMDPITDNFWLDKWQISTKHWDELPKDLIHSHRKYMRILNSPVRENEKNTQYHDFKTL